MNSSFFSHIELTFWNFVIQVLSQFGMARKLFGQASQGHAMVSTTFGILLGLSGLVGLASGYTFYLLTVGVR